MTEQLSRPTMEATAGILAEGSILTMSDQTRHVDRCFQLLSDRRRRFCLYHLIRADTSIPIRELALLVEASVAPAESSLTEWVLDEAVLQLHHTHLPKLRDAGLIEENDGVVELSAHPTLPIQDWIAATAQAELDASWQQEGPHE